MRSELRLKSGGNEGKSTLINMTNKYNQNYAIKLLHVIEMLLIKESFSLILNCCEEVNFPYFTMKGT